MKSLRGREPGPITRAIQDLLARCASEQSRMATLQVILVQTADVLIEQVGKAEAVAALREIADLLERDA